MSKNKTIGDLRDVMFDTLQLLKDKKITVEEAKAMSDIGQTIINSAKVEVDYIRANNGGESRFIDAAAAESFPPGVVGITRHRLAG